MKPTAYMIGILKGFHSHLFFQSNSEKNVGKKIKDSGMHALKETTKNVHRKQIQ